MVLEYSGRHLAMIEAAAALKLVLYFSLLACLFVPFGMATSDKSIEALAIGVAAYLAKIFALAILLPIGETAVAKMRVFRYPIFLGGAFAGGALAVFLLFVSRSF
jgi:formate hydrogenlyase subunit 4